MSKATDLHAIRGELLDLQKAVTEATQGRRDLAITPYALHACAMNLHSFYGGVENILKRALKLTGEEVEKVERWHADLLEAAASERAGQRPAIIGPATLASLHELRGFRHVVRSQYAFRLEADKIKPLVDGLDRLWPMFLEEIEAYLKFIEERS